jgi:hypothetical protein
VLKDKNSRTNKGVAFVQFDTKTQANNGEYIRVPCTFVFDHSSYL